MTAIAALGHLTRDVVAGGTPRPGGGVYYSARALARIGADARIAASCAASDREQLVPPLEAFGLPVAWLESATTTAYSFHYEGDRRVMRQEAVGDPWPADDAVAAAGDAEWVHVGALVRSDFPEATLAALARGRKLLVDAQGLVRTPALGPLRTDGEIGDVLRHVAILKLDDEEAETLVGTADPERLRALRVPEVILTLGSKGSYVVTDDTVEHVAADVVDGPVDPTGAGDTFSAGYLDARTHGAEPVDAARTATRTVASFLEA
ncbi:MAG: PfkB family carbohydrate kinase [Gaiellaceae bacterium]